MLHIQSLPQKKKTMPLRYKKNWLMLFTLIIAVYSENHIKPTNTLCGKNAELLVVKGLRLGFEGQWKRHYIFIQCVRKVTVQLLLRGRPITYNLATLEECGDAAR
jgi:hypothetical protein